MRELLIELQDIGLALSSVPILSGLNLAIKQGEAVTILGKGGAGKSVLLKLIMGLLKPDSGRILIEGRDLVSLAKEERLAIKSKLALVPQGAALLDSLTAAEAIALPLRTPTTLSKRQIRKRVEELLHLVGLEGMGGRYPAHLSGEMRQRVALAQALALQPTALLYDEPAAELDPARAETFSSLILDLHQRLGLTLVVATRDLQSACGLSDRIALLQEGRIAFEGTPEAFRSSNLPGGWEFI